MSLRSPSDGIDLDVPIPGSWLLGAMLVGIHCVTAVLASARGRTGWVEGLLLVRPADVRREVGGQFAPWVTDGEVWRLATSVMLHVDGLHLLLNVVALVALGRLLEPWVGSTRLWAWFAAGGVGGSWMSHAVGVSQSDGASGGAFALLAVALVYGIRWRARLPPDDRRLLGPWLWVFLLLNVVLSFAVPAIDAAGHLGGMLVGVVVGWLPDTRLVRMAEALGLGLFLGTCAFGWLLG